jgi:DNA damage-binding protein 1
LKLGSLADKVDSGGQVEEDRWSIVYVTVNGAIGILAGISEDDYMLLLDVQQNMIKMAAPPTGNMDHSSWRSFDNGTRTSEARGYIDGNLVEKFSALSPRHQQKLVELLSTSISVEDLQTKIENLARFT